MFACWEGQDGYTDSLDTEHEAREFMTGQVSAGIKIRTRFVANGIDICPMPAYTCDYLRSRATATLRRTRPNGGPVDEARAAFPRRVVGGVSAALDGGANGGFRRTDRRPWAATCAPTRSHGSLKLPLSSMSESGRPIAGADIPPSRLCKTCRNSGITLVGPPFRNDLAISMMISSVSWNWVVCQHVFVVAESGPSCGHESAWLAAKPGRRADLCGVSSRRERNLPMSRN